jgi:lysophosphatidylcholine acyltransferase/lyso-PAF acetyltransferase
MSVEYLPPYTPSEEEKADTHLFARNVRQAMADKLKVPVTDQSFDDNIMMAKAAQLHLPVDQAVINLRDVRKVMDLSLADAKKLLEEFGKSEHVNKEGHLSEEGFVELMGNRCGDKQHLKKLFGMVDKHGHGWVDFRDYVLTVCLLNGSDHEGIDGALELAFQCLDTAGKGALGEEELAQVLKMGFPNLTTVEAKRYFEEADEDKDGLVSCRDFLKFCHQHEGDLPKFKEALFGMHANKEAEPGRP